MMLACDKSSTLMKVKHFFTSKRYSEYLFQAGEQHFETNYDY